MTQLSPIFVDASEESRKGYKVEKLAKGEKHSHAVCLRGDPSYQFFGTRADCERWVADRAAKAGFAAVRKQLEDGYRTREGDAVIAFLNELAGGE